MSHPVPPPQPGRQYPAPQYGQPAPPHGHPAPPYGHPAAPYGHPAPQHGQFAPAGSPGHGYGGAPGKRRGGTKRVVFGAIGVCFGGLPLLLGAVIVANAFNNARQLIPNSEFKPVAWHNLAAEEIFPEGLGAGAGRMEEHKGADTWIRQGIAEEAPCEDVLAEGLIDVLADNGCQNVLRATYIDSSESVAVTVAVVVLENGRDTGLAVDWLAEDHLDTETTVAPHPAEEGPAAGFEQAAASTVLTLPWDTSDAPYLIAASAGPIDGRPVNGLPEQWSGHDSDERKSFDGAAWALGHEFGTAFYNSMEGR